MDKEISKYTTYCTGCGLCHSEQNVKFNIDEKGFPFPQLEKTNLIFCRSVCLASGSLPVPYHGKIWGNEVNRYVAWSSNESVRNKASSGGVLTALALFLLDKHKVDGIIQTKADTEKPYRTITVVSKSKEDVLKCCGSRYAISSPLMNLLQLIEDGKRYAFIGKPCDVLALRNFAKVNDKVKNGIKYYLSFFCAGEPSETANLNLVKTLGCNNSNDCSSLTYRGNGWPGFATAIDSKGNSKSITYDESWGKILGRDVRKVCRVCADGTGDAADVACGDAWYSKPDGTPDFSEHEGRNIVFARTEVGAELVNEAVRSGYLVLDVDAANSVHLEQIQNYQYTRKATLGSMQRAYRFCGLSFPSYSRTLLKQYGKHSSTKTKIKRFLGTIKRHMEGKI